jgi:hypothetical protein
VRLYPVLLLACLASGVGLAFALAAGQSAPCVPATAPSPAGCDAITLALHLGPNAPIQRVGRPLAVRPVSPGFIGLSVEYYAVESYAGTHPDALNPVFLQLIRNLDPGQSPVLRIGGDSADWAWVPSPGVARPAGAKVTITPKLLRVLAALGARLNARFILDLDLEAGNPAVARAEALAFLRTIGAAHIRAFEIGNEPELYDVLGWYERNGRPVLGRRPGYSIGDYEREFGRLAGDLPSVSLAGPSSGRPAWSGNLATFAATARRLSVVTVHRYPLQRCQIEPGTPRFPTIAELLAPHSSVGLADSVIPEVAAAHSHGKSIRVDEINSVGCFGAQGVSNTFAAALWMLQASFAMARVGVDGLNFHTLPGARYGLFSFRRIHGRWSGHVAPDYYGLMAFAQAAPPGSKLLSTSVPSGGVQMWATETRSRTIHVVVINTSKSQRTVGLRIPGAHGLAGLTYLRAGSLSSRSVTLDGQTFGGSTSTGVPAATHRARPIAVRPVDGLYAVRVPAPGAAVLTLAARRAGG